MLRLATAFGGMRFFMAVFPTLLVGMAWADDCTFYAKTSAKVSPRTVATFKDDLAEGAACPRAAWIFSHIAVPYAEDPYARGA